mmetsp:Transcript_59465/g.96188  ORF Transcript_59465/g.96188 Transcript_59465/m.96188 type:complete len:460 (+) Transcript_59465:91-1470(+)
MADIAEGQGVSASAKRRAAKKVRDEAHAQTEAEAAPAVKAEPEPKAKAKAKAQAEPAKAPEPEPKAKAKAKAAGKSKAKAAPAPEPAPKKEVVAPDPMYVVDDGSGGAWEEATGLNNKQAKRLKKVEQEKEEARLAAAAAKKVIPGMGPGGSIPGMAPGKGSQDVKGITPDQIIANVSAKAAAAQAQADAEQKELLRNQSSATIQVPEAKIGRVIGPKGANIKLIQEKTGVTKIDTSGEVFTIMGPPQAVSMAEMAIKELIEKGFMSLAYADFKEDGVQVLPSSFPDIIGKQGIIIRKLKEELGVEVSIPETPKNSAPGKKFKVTIAGASEKVELAKQVINDIVMYSHHEITHPGVVHEEVEVPDWAYRFVIGKAGSELRHIQNNYKVKVNIPRDHSACQNVVVVGLEGDVERAQVYIEKVLWNAENQSKGRDREDKTIGDGYTEEPEEDWMKAYMYKR